MHVYRTAKNTDNFTVNGISCPHRQSWLQSGCIGTRSAPRKAASCGGWHTRTCLLVNLAWEQQQMHCTTPPHHNRCRLVFRASCPSIYAVKIHTLTKKKTPNNTKDPYQPKHRKLCGKWQPLEQARARRHQPSCAAPCVPYHGVGCSGGNTSVVLSRSSPCDC